MLKWKKKEKKNIARLYMENDYAEKEERKKKQKEEERIQKENERKYHENVQKRENDLNDKKKQYNLKKIKFLMHYVNKKPKDKQKEIIGKM